jgi:hypothetical protein
MSLETAKQLALRTKSAEGDNKYKENGRKRLAERLTKAVFPAKIRNIMKIIIRYACWNGIMD